MERFMVVGCGGSGGATMAYMMDHLKGLLKTRGIDSLPAGWQFVHVDVPLSEEDGPGGLPNVAQGGGTYVPTGTNAQRYIVVDQTVTHQLEQALVPGVLKLIGPWAPTDPPQVPVPVQRGAGQYRAIGRMITLSHARSVRDAFQSAVTNMYSDKANHDMAKAAALFPAFGDFQPKPPVTLVVSSMAGGAGASMALDVCRVLSTINNVSADTTAVFMFTADTFASLPVSRREGVGPNALAMIGEIVAAQTGAAAAHDNALLTALGVGNHHADRPFARVFPVGSRIGGDGAQLGEGKPEDVYRALGRGLASLMTSNVALAPFVQYDLANPTPGALDQTYFGWGAKAPAALSWHSFGYANISTGRDRYAHYAAQRLARSAVDRLLTGHREKGSTMADSDRIHLLIDSQWDAFLDRVGLPASPGRIHGWLPQVVFPRDHLNQVNQAVAFVRSFLPSPNGQVGSAWRDQRLATLLASQRPTLERVLDGLSTRYAWSFHEGLLSRTKEQAAHLVARLGLPFTKELLTRLRQHVGEFIARELRERPQSVPDVTAFDATAVATLGKLGKDQIQGGDQLIDVVMRSLAGQATKAVEERATVKAGAVLTSYVSGVLNPLINSIEEAQRALEQTVAREPETLGVADLKTEAYRAWPQDGEANPPPRFFSAHNEVLLTDAGSFVNQYEADLVAALGQTGTAPADVRGEVLAQVVAGVWATTSEVDKSPGGLLEETRPWHSDAFRVDPGGNPVTPSPARFAWHVESGDLLGRASGFIRRPGESFSRFIDTTLRDYVRATDANGAESVVNDRSAKVEAAFTKALQLARPLVGATNVAITRLYSGKELAYLYKFSAVPFGGLAIAGALARQLQQPDIDQSTSIQFTAALDQSDAREIALFSSYEHYPPLAFGSLLEPIAQQWHGGTFYARRSFWEWRRSRPLPAALPLADAERQAMVAGWYIARVLGDLRIPTDDPSRAVEIWSDRQRAWLAFPNPLLTPPDTFKKVDWMPAVLESLLLATAYATQEPVFQSLAPYQALRAKWDEGQAPTLQNAQAQLSGLRLVANWLRTGRSSSGAPSHVPGAQAASDPEDRARLVHEWLEAWRSLARDYQDGGKRGAPRSRAEAADLPMLAELADDIVSEIDRVDNVVDMALDLALKPLVDDAQAAPRPAEPEVAAFDFDGLEG
jgi:hypothetical protein